MYSACYSLTCPATVLQSVAHRTCTEKTLWSRGRRWACAQVEILIFRNSPSLDCDQAHKEGLPRPPPRFPPPPPFRKKRPRHRGHGWPGNLPLFTEVRSWATGPFTRLLYGAVAHRRIAALPRCRPFVLLVCKRAWSFRSRHLAFPSNRKLRLPMAPASAPAPEANPCKGSRPKALAQRLSPMREIPKRWFRSVSATETKGSLTSSAA